MTRYITLAEYFWLAEQVTGVNADTPPKRPDPEQQTWRCMPLKPGSVIATSMTRRRYWFAGWLEIIRSLKGTSGLPGRCW